MDKQNLYALIPIAVVAVVVGAFAVRSCSAPSTPRTPGSTPSNQAEGLRWTAERIQAIFDEGRLDTLYQLLPAPWRKDVEKRVAKSAEKIDADVWNSALELMKETAPVIEAQRENIVKLFRANSENKSDWVPSTEDISLFADFISELPRMLDLPTIRKGNLEPFFGNATFLRVLARMASEIQGRFFRLIRVSPDPDDEQSLVFKMRVRSWFFDGDWKTETESEPFIRIDNRFVPKNWADEWDETMAKWDEEVFEWDGSFGDTGKTEVLAAIRTIRISLPRIQKAQSPEELRSALDALEEELDTIVK